MSATAEASVMSPEVAAAFEHCRAVCRARARNFYYGLKLSPEPQRSALFAIYAWMRAADDLADSTAPPVGTNLNQSMDEFRAATDNALSARSISSQPLWIAMAVTAKQFSLPAEHFHTMLDGQVEDVQRRDYRSFDELRGYCYRVASTVGLICIEIWGYDNPAARELAIDRGIAFQLTNILRDYKQDFDAGRIYLPREDFERHQLDPKSLRYWADPRRCRRFMDEQVARARGYYSRSSELEQMIAAPCRPTAWAMTEIYRGLLAKIETDPSQIILSKRVRLGAWRKGMIAMRAKWRAHRGGGAATPVVVRARARVSESASA